MGLCWNTGSCLPTALTPTPCYRDDECYSWTRRQVVSTLFLKRKRRCSIQSTLMTELSTCMHVCMQAFTAAKVLRMWFREISVPPFELHLWPLFTHRYICLLPKLLFQGKWRENTPGCRCNYCYPICLDMQRRKTLPKMDLTRIASIRKMFERTSVDIEFHQSNSLNYFPSHENSRIPSRE